MRNSIQLILILAVLIPLQAAPAFSDPEAPQSLPDEHTLLVGRMAADETMFPVSLVISEDGAHIAFAAKDQAGMFVYEGLDRGSTYEAIAKGTPLFSKGRAHCAYIAYDRHKARVVMDKKPGPWYDGIDDLSFSPDGSRWAYRAAVQGKQVVVADNIQSPSFDFVIKGRGLVFSPDARHLAFAAVRGETGYLVLDGKAKAVGQRVTEIVFSPDAAHLAYSVQKEGRWHAVADELLGPPYDALSNLTYSPDSSHLVYVAQKGSRWVIVLDGRELIGGQQMGMPLFSPDGGHLAYSLIRGGKWHLVLDGDEGPPFNQIGAYVFSSDGSRMAYMADDAQGAAMVVNGAINRRFDAIGLPVFSPDSRQLAFRARLGKRWFIVHNNRPLPGHDGVRRPVFSPDGNHLAYVAIDGRQMWMVMDDLAMGPYDSVTFPYFSPQGTHLAYAACIQGRWRIYVDGRSGKAEFDALPLNADIVFDGERRCRTIAMQLPGPRFVQVSVDIPASRNLKYAQQINP